MKRKTLLIAEDDKNLREGLIDTLEAEGYRVVAAGNGAEALEMFAEHRPDLVLLDVMMPEVNGYDVCRKLRQENRLVPILMLTAKGEEIDKVLGLELGADDYITKPFGVHELRARIAAALRRSDAAGDAVEAPALFCFGDARIDRRCFEGELAGKRFSLTAREMKLLEVLAEHPGQVMSRNELLNAAWGVDYFGTTRTLDQHIAQLRKKIEPVPATPRYLLTVHGVGYRYQPETYTAE
ncbi:MAG: DNA-binding response regulator [Desulfuromonas sp.]|nr:MAG: DNA-binding response regulator [Desulfuromonas sp.]